MAVETDSENLVALDNQSTVTEIHLRIEVVVPGELPGRREVPLHELFIPKSFLSCNSNHSLGGSWIILILVPVDFS
jgi:hypothetical protein